MKVTWFLAISLIMALTSGLHAQDRSGPLRIEIPKA